jgi:hypothetical protein
MPQTGHRKSKKRHDLIGSGGEEFSDVSLTLDSDEEPVTQDQWTFPVVPIHAKREDYQVARTFSESSSVDNNLTNSHFRL